MKHNHRVPAVCDGNHVPIKEKGMKNFIITTVAGLVLAFTTGAVIASKPASMPSLKTLRHDYFVDAFVAHHYFMSPDTFFFETCAAEKFNRVIVRGKYDSL